MSVKITIRAAGEADEVTVDGVYFFNGETHGSAASLLDRSEHLSATGQKVAFVSASNTDVLIYDPSDD